MSTSESTIKGHYDELAGKLKQGAGEAFNNEKLANDGAAQEVKGHAEQAWGSVKEAVHDSTRDTYATRNDIAAPTTAKRDADGHDIRESITSTAQNVKDHIRTGLDHLKH